jgi:DNA polymerase-3 subunit delta
MSTALERDLQKSIQARTFERVYYFHGANDYLKERAVRELIEAVLDPTTRDFNFELVRGESATAERLDTALSTPPMFADRRVVALRDVHALKKAARASLDRYFAHPAADTVLVLVDPAGETPDADILGKSFNANFTQLDDRDVIKWIVDHAQKVPGAMITEPAARILFDAAGSDLGVLASELDKMASYVDGGVIDEEVVRAVAGVRMGETVTDLLDAVAERNAAKALRLIPILLSNPKTSAVFVIMLLSTQMAAIAWGRAAKDRGVPPAGISSGFWAILKQGRPQVARPWGEAVACWTRAIPRWTSDELQAAMRELLAADTSAKDSKVSSEEQLLTSLVLALCAPTMSGKAA